MVWRRWKLRTPSSSLMEEVPPKGAELVGGGAVCELGAARLTPGFAGPSPRGEGGRCDYSLTSR